MNKSINKKWLQHSWWIGGEIGDKPFQSMKRIWLWTCPFKIVNSKNSKNRIEIPKEKKGNDMKLERFRRVGKNVICKAWKKEVQR